MLRMGQMEIAPSRGALRAETTADGNYPKSAVAYDDVADAILALAEDKSGAWARRACYLNYAPPQH
jgi:hypothetical protein